MDNCVEIRSSSLFPTFSLLCRGIPSPEGSVRWDTGEEMDTPGLSPSFRDSVPWGSASTYSIHRACFTFTGAQGR